MNSRDGATRSSACRSPSLLPPRNGAIGVVHAESPHYSWPRALRLLESGHDSAIDNTLLGLDEPVETIRQHRSEAVQGLRALVVGHEPVDEIERTANRWNVDTGAGIASLNRLTLIAINAEQFTSWTFDIDEQSVPSTARPHAPAS